jgi:hypothetical protein
VPQLRPLLLRVERERPLHRRRGQRHGGKASSHERSVL